MKIKAELLPLSGKYYGTEIHLKNEDGSQAEFIVWVNRISDGKPSEREQRAHTEQLVRYGYSDTEIENDPDLAYEICDDHYETQDALEICKVLVDAINKAEFNG